MYLKFSNTAHFNNSELALNIKQQFSHLHRVLLHSAIFCTYFPSLLLPMWTIGSFGFGGCHLRKCFHKENDVNMDSPYFFYKIVCDTKSPRKSRITLVVKAKLNDKVKQNIASRACDESTSENCSFGNYNFFSTFDFRKKGLVCLQKNLKRTWKFFLWLHTYILRIPTYHTNFKNRKLNGISVSVSK